MKRTALYITGGILTAVLLSSCVSKKKFDELARAKTSIDRELLQVKREKPGKGTSAKQGRLQHGTLPVDGKQCGQGQKNR